MPCYTQLKVPLWMLWAAHVCAEVKGPEDRQSPCLSQGLCRHCSPQCLGARESSESPVQEPHLGFFSPFYCSRLMLGHRHECHEEDSWGDSQRGQATRSTFNQLYEQWTILVNSPLGLATSRRVQTSQGPGCMQLSLSHYLETLPKWPWRIPGSPKNLWVGGGSSRGQESTEVKSKKKAIWLKWVCFVMLLLASLPRHIFILREEIW